MKRKSTNGFFSDWQIKTVCLILAVLIYVVFYLGIPSERKISMPLEIILPNDMTVTSLIPSTADLIVSGNEKQIYMVDVSRVKLYADFSNVHSEGVASVPVTIDYSDLLDFIDITDVSIKADPSFVKLYFE